MKGGEYEKSKFPDFGAVFLAGLMVSPQYTVIRSILLIAGGVLVFSFYLVTLIQLIRGHSLSESRKIFWLIAIICVPVVGNIVYLIMNDAFSRKQVPRPSAW